MHSSTRSLFCGLLAAFLVISLATTGKTQPDKNLLKRVEALEEEVANLRVENAALGDRVNDLENASDPFFREVHCPGESIMAALAEADAEGKTGPVIIQITGWCEEDVVISRDNVTIEGATWVGAEDPPQEGFRSLQINGAKGINIERIHLLGGGLLFENGASVSGRTIRIENAPDEGIVSSNGTGSFSYVTIVNSALDGIYLGGDSSLTLDHSHVIESGFWGVDVCCGGKFNFYNTTIEGNGRGGIFAVNGALLDFWGGSIEGGVYMEGLVMAGGGNTNFSGGGVSVVGGSWLNIGGGASLDGASMTASRGSVIDIWGGGLTVKNGRSHGISLNDTSVLAWPQEPQGIEIFNNGGYGIYCEPDPAVAQISSRSGPIPHHNNTYGMSNCPGMPPPPQ